MKLIKNNKKKQCTTLVQTAGSSAIQGTNARKVISEVYALLVLQCTVFGRKSKHKTDVTA